MRSIEIVDASFITIMVVPRQTENFPNGLFVLIILQTRCRHEIKHFELRPLGIAISEAAYRQFYRVCSALLPLGKATLGKGVLARKRKCCLYWVELLIFLDPHSKERFCTFDGRSVVDNYG